MEQGPDTMVKHMAIWNVLIEVIQRERKMNSELLSDCIGNKITKDKALVMRGWKSARNIENKQQGINKNEVSISLWILTLSVKDLTPTLKRYRRLNGLKGNKD